MKTVHLVAALPIAALVALAVGFAVLHGLPRWHRIRRRWRWHLIARARRRRTRDDAGARLVDRLAGTGLHVTETTRQRLHGDHL